LLHIVRHDIPQGDAAMFNPGRTIGGKPHIRVSLGKTQCFLDPELEGDEDEGRAGPIRRAAQTALETAGNVARGILGRLRGGIVPRLASGRRR